MTATKATIRAINKYQRANTRQVQLKLNIKYDQDILAKLDIVDNKQGYIKELIRQDINKDK